MYVRQGKSTGRHLTHMQKGAESLEVGELGSAAGSFRSVDLPRLSFMRSIHREERTLCSPQTYVIAHEATQLLFWRSVGHKKWAANDYELPSSLEVPTGPFLVAIPYLNDGLEM